MRLLIVLALVAGCGPTPPTEGPAAAPSAPTGPDVPFASVADYRQQVGAALAELDAAVGTEASAASSCLTMMHSEQACGGLTDWVVVSAEASDTNRVRALADRVTALTRKANGQFEWESACMAYSAPPVTLRDGRCVAE